ncbi:MAG TPA: hypothetical protein VGK99_12930 [Acidobacteriota bacterium]
MEAGAAPDTLTFSVLAAFLPPTIFLVTVIKGLRFADGLLFEVDFFALPAGGRERAGFGAALRFDAFLVGFFFAGDIMFFIPNDLRHAVRKSNLL